ncbi:MAG TPA: ABC transporter permease, partial [Planctomycetota bacterium]|nr:ABC transporter permease [Planctomycetota bacterium]
HALRRPRTLRLRDALIAAERAGANALPITLLIGFLIGVILAYQSVQPLRRFAAEIYAADLVAISMVRELGPLLTAVVLAGRTGSAFAAEIGTMKVDEELDALSTMGLDPVRFLVLPRVLVAVAMAPLLTLFFELAGLIGGALVLRNFGITFALFASEVVEWVDLSDLLGGLFKALVFGALIGAVGCLRGLQTGIGADAVGRSATSAVVSAIVLIVAADGVFSVLYHELGI